MNHTSYPNLRQSLLLILFFLLSFALYFFLTGTVPQLFGYRPSLFYMSLVISLASPVATFPLIFYISKKSGIQLKWMVRLPNYRLVFLLAILAVFSIIITSPLTNPKEYFNNLLEDKLKLVVFTRTEFDLYITIKFISAILFAPLFEEILFRKQILGLLLKRYSPFISIVLSSILFAAGHLRFNDVGTLFIWGLLLGIVYYKTNSIEASILFHSFISFFTFFIKKEFGDITGLLLFKYVSMMVVSLITIIFIIKYIGRFRIVKIHNQENSPDIL